MYEERNHATMFLLTTTCVRLSTEAADFSVSGSIFLLFPSVYLHDGANAVIIANLSQSGSIIGHDDDERRLNQCEIGRMGFHSN